MHDLIIASSEYTTTNKLIVLVEPYANTGEDEQPFRRDAARSRSRARARARPWCEPHN